MVSGEEKAEGGWVDGRRREGGAGSSERGQARVGGCASPHPPASRSPLAQGDPAKGAFLRAIRGYTERGAVSGCRWSTKTGVGWESFILVVLLPSFDQCLEFDLASENIGSRDPSATNIGMPYARINGSMLTKVPPHLQIPPPLNTVHPLHQGVSMKVADEPSSFYLSPDVVYWDESVMTVKTSLMGRIV